MKNLILGTVFIMSMNSFASTAKSAAQVDCKNESNYPEISKTDLQKMIEAKSVFLVDVNSEESYKEKHIGDAIHFKTNEKNFAQILPKDKNANIVAYCGGPQCTAWKKAAIEACKAGYTNIKHFKDGISGWKKQS